MVAYLLSFRYGTCHYKWCTFVETISITVLLCCYKHSSGRYKHSSRRSISEAARCFRNLCVYEPSTLQKKLSSSSKKKKVQFSEEALWFMEEVFWFVAQLHRKHTCENCSECWRHFFDAYHNLQFTIPYLVLTICASCWHVFTATIIVSLLFCYIQHAMVCSPYSKKCRLPGGVITARRISVMTYL